MILKSLLAASLLASAVFAAPIHTGVAPWLVNGNPVVVETTIPTGIWIANFGGGSWVGTTANDGNPAVGAAPGTYTYTLAIGALADGDNSFSLMYAADNNVTWTLTGGTLSGADSCVTNDCFTGPNGAPRSLSGTITAGSVLTATVVNTSSGVNPTGLLVSGSTSGVPEPSTYAMLLIGGAAAAFARLRRK